LAAERDQVIVPEGIHLLFLPPYSPELQSAERLWSLTNEPIANRSFESLDELEDLLFHRCRRLLQQLDLISGLTFFHWWQACRCRARAANNSIHEPKAATIIPHIIWVIPIAL